MSRVSFHSDKHEWWTILLTSLKFDHEHHAATSPWSSLDSLLCLVQLKINGGWSCLNLLSHDVSIFSPQLTLESLRKRTAGRLRTAEWRKNVARHCALPNLRDIFSPFLPSWVFQPSCCVSSLLLEREKGKQLHRPIKLITKRFRALWYFFNEYGMTFNCVNKKMLKHDWLC